MGVGVVIIKLKANLSSTSHLTSQLELNLATTRLKLKVLRLERLKKKIGVEKKILYPKKVDQKFFGKNRIRFKKTLGRKNI